MLFARWRDRLGLGPCVTIALSVEDDLVGAVTEPVDGGGAQDAVRKRIGPFGDVEVRGHERAFALVALGDDLVEVLVLGPLRGLSPKSSMIKRSIDVNRARSRS